MECEFRTHRLRRIAAHEFDALHAPLSLRKEGLSARKNRAMRAFSCRRGVQFLQQGSGKSVSTIAD